MIRYVNKWPARLSVVLACLWISGCGAEQPSGSVSGKVVHGGQALTKGAVVFVNQDTGIGASSPIDASGNYTLPSIPTGQYQVAIQHPPVPSPDEIERGVEAERVDVPEKFLDPQTSGLTATVNEGPNTVDFTF